jgi:antitoxin ParD1/3/4
VLQDLEVIVQIKGNFGEPLERFIEDEVASGRYSSADAVIRRALTLLRFHEASSTPTGDELRQEIQKGFDSGPGVAASGVFAEMKSRYQALDAAKQRR